MIKYLIPILLAVMSCSSKTEIAKESHLEEDSDSIFKSWLNDTLPEFKKWENNQQKTLSVRSLSFTDDSLVFTVEERFTVDITSDKSSIPDVQNMLDVFSEYGELQKSPFKLSFIKRFVYEPSTIKRFKYTFLEEIDSIYVFSSSQEINYTLIRGRLSGKTTTSLKDPSNTKTTQFIWDGEVLKKVDE